MQKITIGACLLIHVFMSGMELEKKTGSVVKDKAKKTSWEKKMLHVVLLGVEDVTQAREILLPLALTSKQFYQEFDNRFFMQKVIARCALFSGESRGTVAKKLKMNRAEQYIRFNGRFYTATLTIHVDKEKLRELSLFLKLRADPNYGIPGYGRTVLMRAVRLNSPPFVNCLLEAGACAEVRDHRGSSVRNYNLIYNAKELEETVYSVANYMIRSAMREALRPKEPFDSTYEPFAQADARQLRDALYIDKLLEDAGAAPTYDNNNCPLILMLGARDGIIIKETLREMYHYDNDTIKKYVPSWLYKFLYIIPYKMPDAAKNIR